MSPNLRRAFHQALDVVLDALANEEREEQPKAKRTREVKKPALPRIELTDEERERARKGWERDGWRKAG